MVDEPIAVGEQLLRTMYRRPKFLEVLLEIRRQMALEADYDVDLFTEMARSGGRPPARSNSRRESPTLPREKSVVSELSRSKDT